MIISTNGITKEFDGLTAVDHVSLGIEEGEIFGLLGPNGAGKTTLISMLATLLKPTQGTATVNGYDVRKDSDKVRRSIGIVFQDPSSDDVLTGKENLYLHALLYGVSSQLRKQRIDEVLRLVGLEERADSIVKTYSGGMRRRLELARGLLHHPRVLFLDEPTLGLDPQSREHVWKYITDLAEREQITILLTTHYMEEADSLCDRVAIIDQGQIIALDTPDNLKRSLGGDIICITTSSEDTHLLSDLPYVHKAELSNCTLILTVENAAKHLPEILSKIHDVSSVETRSPTLNDVFLHYTGKQIREDAPEGGWVSRVVRSRARG